MILADTDILSAMAKIGRLQSMWPLFRIERLYITPAVFEELDHSFNMGRQYAKDVFSLLASGRIEMLYLGPEETAFRDEFPPTLGAGERETMAVARERGGTVLSNESRVAHVCRQCDIRCLQLSDILRALWVYGVATREDVHAMVNDLRVKDRMQFKQTVLDAIFAD